METVTMTKPRAPKQPIMTRQRKQLALNFIHEFRRIKQVSPTFEEIAVGIGYSRNSEGTAFSLIQDLIAEGWLIQAVPGARGIVPAKGAGEEYAKITDPELKAVARRQRNLNILRRL